MIKFLVCPTNTYKQEGFLIPFSSSHDLPFSFSLSYNEEAAKRKRQPYYSFYTLTVHTYTLYRIAKGGLYEQHSRRENGREREREAKMQKKYKN